MKVTELTQHETTITHALRVAADRFEDDATNARQLHSETGNPEWLRLEEQFKKQVEESRQLADRIDEEGFQ